MRSLLTLSLLTYVLLGHQSTADATMVKCKGDPGSVVYQDEPCKPGMELRNFDTDPATVSVVPGSPVAAISTLMYSTFGSVGDRSVVDADSDVPSGLVSPVALSNVNHDAP